MTLSLKNEKWSKLPSSYLNWLTFTLRLFLGSNLPLLSLFLNPQMLLQRYLCH